MCLFCPKHSSQHKMCVLFCHCKSEININRHSCWPGVQRPVLAARSSSHLVQNTQHKQQSDTNTTTFNIKHEHPTQTAIRRTSSNEEMIWRFSFAEPSVRCRYPKSKVAKFWFLYALTLAVTASNQFCWKPGCKFFMKPTITKTERSAPTEQLILHVCVCTQQQASQSSCEQNAVRLKSH